MLFGFTPFFVFSARREEKCYFNCPIQYKRSSLAKNAICRTNRELFNDLFFVVFSGISGSQAGPGSKKKSVLSIAQPSIGDQDHYHEIDTDGGNFPFHFGAGGAL